MSVSREELADRLRSRRVEIEQAVLARTTSVPDAPSSNDPEYREGFRVAVSAGVEYCLSVIEMREGEIPPPIPVEILAQARLAARNAIGLDAVNRRYIAGSHLLDSFILEEIELSDWEALHRLRATALDLLLQAVSAEYKRASEHRSRSRDAEKLHCVERLLKGEATNARTLDYDLNQNHVALVAKGHGAESHLRHLARFLDSCRLAIRPDDESVWAWLGRRREIDHSRLCVKLSTDWEPGILLAVGEAAAGVAGWRRSHRQAQSALVIAQRGIASITHYRRDCLLASLLQDESLASLLWSLYIAPILSAGERSSMYLDTLRAYLKANRNGVSAAASLGVSRQTVTNHLRAIEEKIDTPIPAAGAELELALRLHAVGFAPPDTDPTALRTEESNPSLRA